ncbi:MAG: hypothetical protein ACLSAF_11390 [Intestinimonas sp.]
MDRLVAELQAELLRLGGIGRGGGQRASPRPTIRRRPGNGRSPSR